MSKNHYETLGIEPSASSGEIKSAYRKLARKFHPDVDSSEQANRKFKEINEAYKVLSDSRKRISYNESILSDNNASSHIETITRKDLFAAWQRVFAYAITGALFGGLLASFIDWILRDKVIFSDIWPLTLTTAILGFMRGIDSNFVVADFIKGAFLTFVRLLRFLIWIFGVSYLTWWISLAPILAFNPSDEKLGTPMLITALIGASIGFIISLIATSRDH